MGTRNLTVVKKNGEIKIANYGQWDGYPAGAGQSILDAISNEYNVKNLNESAANSSWASEEYVNEKWRTVGVEPTDDDGPFFVPWDKSSEFESRYPTLGRDLGAGIVGYMVEHPEGIKSMDSFSFASNPDCEWAYALDLDNDQIEVYCRYENYAKVGSDTRVIDSDTGMKLILVDKISNPEKLPELIDSNKCAYGIF